MKPRRKPAREAHLVDGEVKAHLADLFRDSMLQIQSSRDLMSKALAAMDAMPITSFKDASAFFRASAAHAAACKAHLDSARPFAVLTETKATDLPVFRVEVMTNEMVGQMRETQRIEDIAIYGEPEELAEQDEVTCES